MFRKLVIGLGAAVALFFLLGVIGSFLPDPPAKAGAPELEPVAQEKLERPAPPTGPELLLGGVYITREGHFAVARDKESLLDALVITGPRGVFSLRDAEELTELGIEGFTRRHKVRIIGASEDGQLVQIKVVGTEEVRWVTAEALVTPFRDREQRWIQVGKRYTVAGHGQVGAATAEAATRVREAVVAALPEKPLTFPPSDWSPAEWQGATREVVQGHRDLVALPEGTALEVIDIDMDNNLAVQARVLESGAEVWILAMSLSRAEE